MGEWKTLWSYLPVDYGTGIGTVENVTQRTVFWNNLSGNKIRLKFSNIYGSKPLLFEKVVIAKKSQKEEKITGFTTVKKDNSEWICIEPEMEFFSDEIDWSIEAGTELVLSVYIKKAEEVKSACSSLSGRSWHTVYSKKEGSYVTEQSFDEISCLNQFPKLCQYPDPNMILIGVREIQVFTERSSKQMVMFGDSIIHMSWFSDAVMSRLYKEKIDKIAILNRGISGNRILHGPLYVDHIPGNGSIYGKAAIKRFESDCFSNGVPEYIIFLEGINDMIFPEWFSEPDENITAEELKSAIIKMAELAHKKGSEFWIGTLLPYQNPENLVCPKAEKIRQQLNHWIRKQNITDSFLDFDRVLSDPNNSGCLKEKIHIGDWIHPNEKGGEIMAEEVFGNIIHDFLAGYDRG